jgi:hypothetical protein
MRQLVPVRGVAGRRRTIESFFAATLLNNDQVC